MVNVVIRIKDNAGGMPEEVKACVFDHLFTSKEVGKGTWYQRKYRRLVVIGERQKVYFDAFLDLATIHIWINKILLVG
ncbi:hypothetical protein LC653_03525 [Nostoc sp. CHAB 5784]|uniref:hypothetical protein n=1 Tax=Nostoc mirabile TaxID=2907820 RepID=UPI001E3404B0|nr:hypothetical protein [Nostoc mirabile]MCC5663030.1 hypothetical protein [Nostoc mirabile CHAB5784]